MGQQCSISVCNGGVGQTDALLSYHKCVPSARSTSTDLHPRRASLRSLYGVTYRYAPLGASLSHPTLLSALCGKCAVYRVVLRYKWLVISVLWGGKYAIRRAERHGFVGNRGESARHERVSVDSNPSSTMRAEGTH
jgi:hypothetical protein